jgi:hypothetical protein
MADCSKPRGISKPEDQDRKFGWMPASPNPAVDRISSIDHKRRIKDSFRGVFIRPCTRAN